MANAAGLDAFKEIHETEKKAAGKKLKVGIIGTGWIAECHAECYQKMDDVEIVALADLIPGKAQAFAERFGITGARIYESDEAMLAGEKELDGVSICTYNCQHAPCAIHALDAGVNVMLEKPFTVTLDEATDVTMLKNEALSTARDNTAFVYKENANGEMEQVEVTVGVSNGNYVEIKSGVTSGETVYKIAEKEEQASGLAGLFSGLFGNPGQPAGRQRRIQRVRRRQYA